VARGKWNPLAATGTSVEEVRGLCDDAVLGIELALADMEFTDGRLARRLLTKEVRRAVSRTFSGAGHTVRDGTPHGEQEGINSGAPTGGAYPMDPAGELPPQPKPKDRSGWCDGCCDCDCCCNEGCGEGCDCDCCDCCDCGDCCDCN